MEGDRSGAGRAGRRGRGRFAASQAHYSPLQKKSGKIRPSFVLPAQSERISEAGNHQDFPPNISGVLFFRSFAVTECKCRSPSRKPFCHLRHPPPRPVPFHWDTSPFIGIRPLSSGYVPFHRDTSPFRLLFSECCCIPHQFVFEVSDGGIFVDVYGFDSHCFCPVAHLFCGQVVGECGVVCSACKNPCLCACL